MSNISIKRILNDKKNLERNPLDKYGIYAIFEEDIYKAKALIIGPSDTPYYGGYYLFDIIFPQDYPFQPPKVVLRTLDPYGYIRLNPNLYTNGKVCLSILNTWTGPKWTSCLNLSSVLISIQSLLNNNPMHNEPGYENDNSTSSISYRNILEHENISISILNILENIPNTFDNFMPIIRDHFINNFHNLKNRLIPLINTYKENTIERMTSLFKLQIKYKYNYLLKKLLNIYNTFTEFSKIDENELYEEINKSAILSKQDKDDINIEIKNITENKIKKYTRKSPNELAKLYDIGYIKISENDDNKYIVSIDKNNVKRWKKYKEEISNTY